VRFFVIVFILLGTILPVRNAQGAAALERGAAITDPSALRELDRGRFGVSRVLLPASSAELLTTFSCSIARGFIPLIHASCWRASSTGWIALISLMRTAVKSG
jgi:hypothetical protein